MYQCYIHNYFIVNLFLIMSFTFLDICLRNLKLEVSCHKFFWEYEGFTCQERLPIFVKQPV